LRILRWIQRVNDEQGRQRDGKKQFCHGEVCEKNRAGSEADDDETSDDRFQLRTNDRDKGDRDLRIGRQPKQDDCSIDARGIKNTQQPHGCRGPHDRKEALRRIMRGIPGEWIEEGLSDETRSIHEDLSARHDAEQQCACDQYRMNRSDAFQNSSAPWHQLTPYLPM
jgi:hypothetical protein